MGLMKTYDAYISLFGFYINIVYPSKQGSSWLSAPHASALPASPVPRVSPFLPLEGPVLPAAFQRDARLTPSAHPSRRTWDHAAVPWVPKAVVLPSPWA